MPQEERLGFAFLPSFGSERMGSRFGSHSTQFPGLLSASCKAQISHSVAHSVSQFLVRSLAQVGHMVPLYCCLCACSTRQVGCKVQLGYCLCVHNARLAGCTVPLRHSLWALVAEISLRELQLLLESSLQSSYPQFLRSTPHSPTFQPVQRLSKSGSDTAQLLPSPSVT